MSIGNSSHYAWQSPLFSLETPPTRATVTGRRVPAWAEQNGSAEPLPPSLGQTTARVEALRRIPYGCTNLRIAGLLVVTKNRAMIQVRDIE